VFQLHTPWPGVIEFVQLGSSGCSGSLYSWQCGDSMAGTGIATAAVEPLIMLGESSLAVECVMPCRHLLRYSEPMSSCSRGTVRRLPLLGRWHCESAGSPGAVGFRLLLVVAL
jgi:hypothetical protein